MEISLANDPTHYSPGQVVTGLLKISADSNVRPEDVKISLEGLEEVKWCPENLMGICHSLSPISYHQKKNWLKMVTDCAAELGKQTDQGLEFPFEFHLPNEGIPSSFKGLLGSIAYKLSAEVKSTDGRVQMVDKEVQVLAPLKQNLNISVINSAEKDFGLLSPGSGRLYLYASISRKCYSPGDHIQVHINVFNDSTVETTPRVTLYQNQIYLFADRHKAFQVAITEQVVGERVAKDDRGYQTLTLVVPKEAALSIKTELIAVKYLIHVTLDIKHAFDIHANLPLVLC